MCALILTGWGWKEYPVAAAEALKCSRNTARKYLEEGAR